MHRILKQFICYSVNFRFVAVVLVAVQILSACGNFTYHVVQPGDTLYSIGWAYSLDYRQLSAWNHIDPPYIISKGEVIKLVPPQGWKEPITKSTNEKIKVVKPAKDGENNSKSNARFREQQIEKNSSNKSANKLVWRWPADGKVLPTFKTDSRKRGLQILRYLGEPIIAAAEGRVVYSGNGLIGYGNLVIIKHNETFLSAYAHNKKLLVKEGEYVKAGEKIAEMGSSDSNRVVLHFEIRRDGKPVNPLYYLPERKLQ